MKLLQAFENSNEGMAFRHTDNGVVRRWIDGWAEILKGGKFKTPSDKDNDPEADDWEPATDLFG